MIDLAAGAAHGAIAARRRNSEIQRERVSMPGLNKGFVGLVAGAALLLATASARAENFPSKPVHILVPYAAGGPEMKS